MSFAPLSQTDNLLPGQDDSLGEFGHHHHLHHRSGEDGHQYNSNSGGGCQPMEISSSAEVGNDEDDDDNHLKHPQHNSAGPTLKLIPLSVLIFYGVSGGPFGIEETVRSAGFFYSIVGFIVMPLVWSVPESLVTAELSSTFPEPAGGVAWADEAFGPLAGWMTGYLGWISGATDNAIYPVLFLDYVLQIWSSDAADKVSHGVVRFLVNAGISTVLAYVNWLGLSVVGNMSIVICLLSMSPFLIMSIIGLFQADTDQWFQLPEDPSSASFSMTAMDDIITNSTTSSRGASDSMSGLAAMGVGNILWRPYLNNLFWNLNSFDSAASFAAEVDNPGKTMPNAMLLACIMVSFGYLIPLIAALGATDSSQHDWVDGYLATAASEIGGAWLGDWVVFAAGVSNIALFQAELSSDAFQLMGMSERGFVPKIFSIRSQHGTPTYGILFGLGVIICMGSFNLDTLIEMLNFNYAISLLIEYSSFIKLRISKSHVPRPFRIPFGTCGCMLLLVPPLVATTTIMALASWSTIIFSCGVNAVGILLFYASSSGKSSASHDRMPTMEAEEAMPTIYRDEEPIPSPVIS